VRMGTVAILKREAPIQMGKAPIPAGEVPIPGCGVPILKCGGHIPGWDALIRMPALPREIGVSPFRMGQIPESPGAYGAGAK